MPEKSSKGTASQLGYYAQEHETLDPSLTVYENVRHNAPPTVSDAELRRILGSFLFGWRTASTSWRALCRAERRTRLALATLVRVSGECSHLLDERRTHLDPASRGEGAEGTAPTPARSCSSP